jgi:hypothetical protein
MEYEALHRLWEEDTSPTRRLKEAIAFYRLDPWTLTYEAGLPIRLRQRDFHQRNQEVLFPTTQDPHHWTWIDFMALGIYSSVGLSFLCLVVLQYTVVDFSERTRDIILACLLLPVVLMGLWHITHHTRPRKFNMTSLDLSLHGLLHCAVEDGQVVFHRPMIVVKSPTGEHHVHLKPYVIPLESVRALHTPPEPVDPIPMGPLERYIAQRLWDVVAKELASVLRLALNKKKSMLDHKRHVGHDSSGPSHAARGGSGRRVPHAPQAGPEPLAPEPPLPTPTHGTG